MKADKNAPARGALGDRAPTLEAGREAVEPTPNGGGRMRSNAFENEAALPGNATRVSPYATDAPAATRRLGEKETGDAPLEVKGNGKTYRVSRRLADEHLRRLRDNFVFFGMWEPARLLTERQLRPDIIQTGGVFDLRPRTEFERFVDDWKAHNLPGRDAMRPAESPHRGRGQRLAPMHHPITQ
jgi:hypothetical protein